MEKCPHCKGSLKNVSLDELYLLNCPHCKKMVLTKKEFTHLKVKNYLSNINKITDERTADNIQVIKETPKELDYFEPEEPNYEDRMPENLPTYDEDDYMKHFVNERSSR